MKLLFNKANLFIFIKAVYACVRACACVKCVCVCVVYVCECKYAWMCEYVCVCLCGLCTVQEEVLDIRKI